MTKRIYEAGEDIQKDDVVYIADDGKMYPVRNEKKDTNEEYIKPYYFGWVKSQFHPDLTTIEMPSDRMIDLEKDETLNIGDYVEFDMETGNITKIIKKPKD